MGDEGKIFVGGLSFDTTEESLEDAFSKYGKIVKADVIRDRETQKPRGFGFVTFENPDDADNALRGMNGKDVDGRQIRVDKAGKSGSRSGGGGGYRGGRGGGYFRGGGSRGGRGGYGSSDRSYGEDRGYGGDRGYSGYSQRTSGSGYGSGGYSGSSSSSSSGGGYRDRSQNYDRSYNRESYDS